MKRLAAIVCGTTLAVAALAGCGSDDGGDSNTNASGGSGGDYCSQVKSAQDTLEKTSDPKATLDDLRSQADSMKAVADVAPDEVSKDWSNLADYSDKSVSVLEGAGLDTDKPLGTSMVEMQKQDPEGAKKLQESMPEQPASLSSDSAAIQKQVKDECDIDLSSGSAQ